MTETMSSQTRRKLLTMIGKVGGGVAMYQAKALA
jgi:hypothetical protein